MEKSKYKGKFVKLQYVKKVKYSSYISTHNPDDFTEAIIIDAQFKKGITIVDAKDPEVIITCLYYAKSNYYEKRFNEITKDIETGIVTVFRPEKIRHLMASSEETLQKHCPYNK